MPIENKQKKIKQQMEVLNNFLAARDPNMDFLKKEQIKIFYKRGLTSPLKKKNFEALKERIFEWQNEK